jgi:hypothetical protein
MKIMIGITGKLFHSFPAKSAVILKLHTWFTCFLPQRIPQCFWLHTAIQPSERPEHSALSYEELKKLRE